jgi:hypothetical protein
MATNRMTTVESTTTAVNPRRHSLVSGLAVRILIALVISWLVVMAFFVTNVASH